MRDMETKRCYGCMKLKTDSPVCEHCGFDETSANASHQLPMGTVMQGKYLIGKVLGQGGFGITYLGWDLFLEMPVAIKEYYPGGVVMRDCSHSLSVSSGGEGGSRFQNNRERFLREAKSLARFDGCPEIVKVSNYFLENNTAYIVMEFVQGITLKQHIKNRGGTLTPEETFELLKPIIRALDRVHATGLVHRDISPDNIMLLPDGGVKLIDFGAVRDVQNAGAETPLTKSTEAILKQGYAPIEQYQKRGALGPWTDVYALCGTIYYCLTGQVPMDAPERVLGDEEFSWKTVPGLTEQQAAALEKGMALLPKDRTQSMKALDQELFATDAPPKKEIELGGTPVPAPPAPKNKSRKGVLLAAAAVVLALAVGIAALGGEKKDAPAEGTVQLQETAAVTQPVPAETSLSTATEAEEPWEKNVMKNVITWKDGFYYGVICDSDVQVTQVVSVTFLDDTGTAPSASWDVSVAGDGSVLAWVSGFDGKYDLYIAADGGINGREACAGMFTYFNSLTEINFNDCFHTEQTTDMSGMFASCESLKDIDLSSLDTSNVTDMSSMFNFCSALEEVDLNCLDTSNVRNMQTMFGWCRSLKKVGLESWDTSKVENFSGMFYRCLSMEQLDLSTFDTSSAVYMAGMFRECSRLQELDICNFNTSNVINMEGMFYQSNGLQSLDLSSFDTAKVAWYDNFMGDGKKVNGKTWTDLFDPSVKSTRWIYNVMDPNNGAETVYDTPIKKSEVVSATFFDGSDGSQFTQNYTWLETMGEDSIIIWFSRKGQNSYDMYIQADGGINGKLAAEGLFEGFTNLAVVRFNGAFHTDEAVSLRNMFAGCEKLSTVDFSGFNTENVTDMSGMFQGCTSLKNPDLGSFDTSKVTAYDGFMNAGMTVNGKPWEQLFQTSAPTAKDSAGWEKNVLKNFSGFSYGHQYTEVILDSDIEVTKIVSATFLDTLENAPVSSWDVSEAGDGSVLAWVNGDGQQYDLFIAAEGGINGKIACKELFNGYKNLKRVDFGGNFHTEQATDFSCMFADCRALESLDISTLDTSSATNMWAMFNNCRSLKTIDLGSMDTSNVTDMKGMFAVSGLESLDLSGFDTSSATTMEGMFMYCEGLTELDLSAFDTSNVTTMEHMFYHSTKLKSVDLSSFDTSNVTNMTGMFRECTGLNDLNLSHFDVSKVTQYEFFMEQGKKVNGQPWAYLFSE